jgi:3'-5' exonuclease
MNTLHALDKVLFIDIETVPEHPDFSMVSEETQHLFEEKTKYQRKDDFSTEEFYDRAGIWAEFGKIVCISVGFLTFKNEERQLRIRSFYGEEADLLKDFSQLVETYFSTSEHFICGHNIKEFDLPFIGRRMLIHNLPLPEPLRLYGKRPWEIKHLDTLELWKFGDYKHYTSLKLLTHVLGIPSPKNDIDGSQVKEVYYKEKDLKRIVAYCEQDVIAVAQVLLKFHRQALLGTDEVFVWKA